jgi:hypothetical protein
MRKTTIFFTDFSNKQKFKFIKYSNINLIFDIQNFQKMLNLNFIY